MKTVRTVKWNMLYPDEHTMRLFFRKRAGFDDDLKQLKNLFKKLTPQATKTYKLNSSSFFKPSFASGKQFVTFKMNYSNKMASHQKFLKYYMSQENKENVKDKPMLFGASDNLVINDYEKTMSERHFKFMLSPESSKVPLKDFTRAFMTKVSKELGIDFDYVASIHTDTSHPHVHILINGKDSHGKELKRPFPKSFIQRRAHEIASDITTAIIGERTAEQKTHSYNRSFTATRFTTHDEKIKEILQEGLEIRNPSEQTHRRLSHLCSLKLAKYENKTFTLEKNWDTTLRTVGRYNSFLKARDEIKWSIKEELELFQSGSISGVVRKVYSLNDEFENDNAMVIENPVTKKAYFVPLYNPLSAKAEGKNCSVTMSVNAKGRLVPKIEYEKEETLNQKNKKSYNRQRR
ncbi:MAG: relaxase/mobilization nuclease domain-containing protein [Spirochaetales bacterium]